jgi:rod shape determining protein RodA
MFARLDWPVFLLVLALCGAGLLNVYSGTRVFPSSGISIFYKQLVWILLGLGVFFLFYFMGSGLIEEMAWHVFIAVVALLLFVLLIGKVRGGAQRWLSLGFLAFQPSEFAKIALILVLARYFSGRYAGGGDHPDTVPARGVAARSGDRGSVSHHPRRDDGGRLHPRESVPSGGRRGNCCDSLSLVHDEGLPEAAGAYLS